MTPAKKTNPYTDKPAPVHPAIAAKARAAGARPLSSDGLRCSQPQCATDLDPGPGHTRVQRDGASVLETDGEFRKAFALAHGFHESNGKLFCSKRCLLIEQSTPSGLAGEQSTGGLPHVATKRKLAAAGITLGRVSLSTLPDVDGSGETHWALCAHPGCQTKIEVPPGDVETSALRAAAAHGFVETESGVYCGGMCARQHASEIAHHTVRSMPTQPPAARVDCSDGRLAQLDIARALVRDAALAYAGAHGVPVTRVELLLAPGTGHVVALVGNGRRIAFEADTLRAACTYAISQVHAFCANSIGEFDSPFSMLTPLRVGALTR